MGSGLLLLSQVPLSRTLEENKAAKGSSENSPYSSMMQSPSKAIEKMLKDRLNPEEVAKTIVQAIENSKPKLRYIVGKDAEELIEFRRKSSDEEFFQIIGQNIVKKEEQEFPQNRNQVAAEEQFRIKKVVVDGERTAN